MKKTLKIAFLAFAFLVMGRAHSYAVLIVDTDIPSMISGMSLTPTQYLAGEITLPDAKRISDIEGWIDQYDQVATSLTLSIYGDAGLIPDGNDLIFRNTFLVPGCGGGSCADWYGLHGMSLDLGPGSYWVAFEVLAGNTYDGAMSVIPPHPLNYAAFYNAGTGSMAWWSQGQAGFGLRVYSDESTGPAVPEPSTIVLSVLGLGGLAFKKKFKNP
ncbi:MAG TPA: PEP-CTERM sorting domain-containing protein [Candidatus Omnitrophota bacterium]|nr:PEP-CTERM sorting domain-containing protein [Candidatus Omnitrophota bacterium]